MNSPISTVLTVKFFLQVILSFHRFKKVCFLSENGLSGLGAYYIIEKRTSINYTENLSSRIFIYSFLKANHNLSVKTQFLRRVLCIIFTVYYFLDVILSIYRFKKDCFPFKDGMKSNNDMPAGTYFEYFYSPRLRGQKYPLQGVTGFNQVVIKLQQAVPKYWHYAGCVTLL